MERFDDKERAIERLATTQHGVVTRGQLLALGLGVGAIEARLRKRRLIRLHRGTYAVGHQALRREGWWMAAALAHGSGAVLSHHTAAAAWDLRPPRDRIDVSVPPESGCRRSQRGIRLHRVAVPADEVTVLGALPVVTVPRVLLDLATVLAAHHLEQVIHEADIRGLFDLTAVQRVIDRAPPRPGVRSLRSLLDALAGRGAQRTRSELEVRFLALCARHGLPIPAANARIEGFEVDFHWPGTRLVVETDGAWHRMPQQRERDHAKRLALEAAGWHVIPLTFRQVTEQGPATAARLRRILRGAA